MNLRRILESAWSWSAFLCPRKTSKHSTPSRVTKIACSRREVGRLASKPGKAIKGYASGKFLPLGLGSGLTSGSRNGGSAPDPHLYEVAYANHGFKETD